MSERSNRKETLFRCGQAYRGSAVQTWRQRQHRISHRILTSNFILLWIRYLLVKRVAKDSDFMSHYD